MYKANLKAEQDDIQEKCPHCGANLDCAQAYVLEQCMSCQHKL